MESFDEFVAQLSPIPLPPQDQAYFSNATDTKEEDHTLLKSPLSFEDPALPNHLNLEVWEISEDLTNPFSKNLPKEDVKRLAFSPEAQVSTGSTIPSTSEAKKLHSPPTPGPDSLFCLFEPHQSLYSLRRVELSLKIESEKDSALEERKDCNDSAPLIQDPTTLLADLLNTPQDKNTKEDWKLIQQSRKIQKNREAIQGVLTRKSKQILKSRMLSRQIETANDKIGSDLDLFHQDKFKFKGKGKRKVQIEIEMDEFEMTEAFTPPKEFPRYFSDPIRQERILLENSFHSGSHQTNGAFFEEECAFPERKTHQDQHESQMRNLDFQKRDQRRNGNSIFPPLNVTQPQGDPILWSLIPPPPIAEETLAQNKETKTQEPEPPQESNNFKKTYKKAITSQNSNKRQSVSMGLSSIFKIHRNQKRFQFLKNIFSWSHEVAFEDYLRRRVSDLLSMLEWQHLEPNEGLSENHQAHHQDGMNKEIIQDPGSFERFEQCMEGIRKNPDFGEELLDDFLVYETFMRLLRISGQRLEIDPQIIEKYLVDEITGAKNQDGYRVKITTQAHVKGLLHSNSEIPDNEELKRKKAGARLAFDIYFRAGFYERSVKKRAQKLEKKDQLAQAQAIKDFFTNRKLDLYEEFVRGN